MNPKYRVGDNVMVRGRQPWQPDAVWKITGYIIYSDSLEGGNRMLWGYTAVSGDGGESSFRERELIDEVIYHPEVKVTLDEARALLALERGEPPDPKAINTLKEKGIVITDGVTRTTQIGKQICEMLQMK